MVGYWRKRQRSRGRGTRIVGRDRPGQLWMIRHRTYRQRLRFASAGRYAREIHRLQASVLENCVGIGDRLQRRRIVDCGYVDGECSAERIDATAGGAAV